MTSILGCIRNIAPYSPQLQFQKAQEAQDQFISRILSALNSCSFKWPTFNSEFYLRVPGSLGERTSNISPLSYKTQSPTSLLMVDNTTRTPESSQAPPSNAQPHQVPHRQCSQRGSPSVLRVGPGRTTNRSPSSPGENFARG